MTGGSGTGTVAGGVVLAVLPVGATEQHGPHLPVETDTLLATAAARALAPGADAAAGIGCEDEVEIGVDFATTTRVLPALASGARGEHQAFPGTVSMGTDALAMSVLEIGRSVATWADRLLVVNGHGGNVEALRRAVTRLRFEGRDAAWLSCRASEDPADTHAGHAETSLLLHLHPELVRTDLAEPGCTEPLAHILPAMRRGGVAAVSSNGVLGDPTTATDVEGERLWGLLVADARRRLEVWRPGPDDGMLR